MNELIRREHKVSIIMYHIVCPAEYRRTVMSKEIDEKLIEICRGIEARYEIKFLEIGTEKEYVHFLVQSVPSYSPARIVRTIKSITAKKIFESYPEVKKALWGGEFWAGGYYIGTAGEHGDEQVISRYVKNQGRSQDEYKKIYESEQQELFI
jgi:REP element-mobilizing transposase RayT